MGSDQNTHDKQNDQEIKYAKSLPNWKDEFPNSRRNKIYKKLYDVEESDAQSINAIGSMQESCSQQRDNLAQRIQEIRMPARSSLQDNKLHGSKESIVSDISFFQPDTNDDDDK